MSDNNSAVNELSTNMNSLKVEKAVVHPLLNANSLEDCETAEEAVTTDSEEYLSEPLRYKHIPYSSSTTSSVTVQNEENDNYYSCTGEIDFNNLQIPIVGYEVMEERARFTVFKLRIENKSTGDCWYVFRRYTDFVRLCNRLKHKYPHVIQHLPRKRWLGNNFDPVFLEERLHGLQNLVNAILRESDLLNSQQIQDFFCLNEPPVYSETNEESRAIFEALEETITELKQQLKEKEILIDTLQDTVHTKAVENENLRKLISTSLTKCSKCQQSIDATKNF